jgi:hypothetical protein
MTARANDNAWSDFVAWCEARRLRPLPAHPWTVAAYARWCESRYRQPDIVKRIGAISRVHLLRCTRSPVRHPTVTRTLRMIETRFQIRVRHAVLFRAEDFADTATPAPSTPAKGKKTGRKVQSRTLRTSPRLVSRRPVDA